MKRGSDFSQSAPDVEHPIWSIEAKYRHTLPKLITDGLKQAASYDKDKTPLLVVKQHRMKDAIVCLWRKDFIDWFGKVP